MPLQQARNVIEHILTPVRQYVTAKTGAFTRIKGALGYQRNPMHDELAKSLEQNLQRVNVEELTAESFMALLESSVADAITYQIKVNELKTMPQYQKNHIIVIDSATGGYTNTGEILRCGFESYLFLRAGNKERAFFLNWSDEDINKAFDIFIDRLLKSVALKFYQDDAPDVAKRLLKDGVDFLTDPDSEQQIAPAAEEITPEASDRLIRTWIANEKTALISRLGILDEQFNARVERYVQTTGRELLVDPFKFGITVEHSSRLAFYYGEGDAAISQLRAAAGPVGTTWGVLRKALNGNFSAAASDVKEAIFPTIKIVYTNNDQYIPDKHPAIILIKKAGTTEIVKAVLFPGEPTKEFSREFSAEQLGILTTRLNRLSAPPNSTLNYHDYQLYVSDCQDDKFIPKTTDELDVFESSPRSSPRGSSPSV